MKDWINSQIKEKQQKNLLRKTTPLENTGAHVLLRGVSRINFCSNDYLGLTKNAEVIKAANAATETYGSACGSSRLLSGTLKIHEVLEENLARWKGSEAALVYGAGYLANIGMLSSLIRREDVVFSDKYIHASLIDGIVLSRATHRRFKHNDINHLQQLLKKEAVQRKRDTRFFIITESVFSMDGDLAPLEALAEIAKAFDAVLIVDEAHAVGVFGPSGAGVINREGLVDSIYLSTFTLSKAFASYGGVVSCPKEVRELLVNTSRSFIYNTSLPPSVIAAAEAALCYLEQYPSLGATLLDKAAFFRDALQQAGLNVLESQSQIIPVIVGESERSLRFSRGLEEEGILAPAIREPTVPHGTARIRFSICLDHTIEDLQTAVKKITKVAQAENLL